MGFHMVVRGKMPLVIPRTVFLPGGTKQDTVFHLQ